MKSLLLYSTVNQFVDIYSLCKAIDEGKEVRVIMCDIIKAFDRVWHKNLHLHLPQWFTNYPNNRKQRVALPGVFSTLNRLKSWCASISILGPILFFIYINDIVHNINLSIRLFADDTSLYIIVKSPIKSAAILHSDISQIYTWASNWLVTLNPLKTESVLFSWKIIQPLHPVLYMNHQNITTLRRFS